jgi:hypothetical protein
VRQGPYQAPACRIAEVLRPAGHRYLVPASGPEAPSVSGAAVRKTGR